MKKSLLLLSVVAIGSLHGMQAGSMSDTESEQPRTGRAVDQHSAALQIIRDHGLLGEQVTLPYNHALKLATFLQEYARQKRAISGNPEINGMLTFHWEPIKATLKRADLAGTLPEDIDLIISCLKNPRRNVGGLLLFGPPGTGKTTIAEAIAGETGRDFYSYSTGDLVSPFKNNSVDKIKSLFATLRASKRPSIIFLDEIESAARKSNAHDATEDSDVRNKLLTEINSCNIARPSHVYVICATNNKDILSPAFLSRFEGYTVEISLPSKKDRADVLLYQLRKHDEEIDEEYPNLLPQRSEQERQALVNRVLSSTNGFSKRSLMNLVRKSGDRINHAIAENGVERIQEKHLKIALFTMALERKAANRAYWKSYCTLDNGIKAFNVLVQIIQVYQALKGLHLNAAGLRQAASHFLQSYRQSGENHREALAQGARHHSEVISSSERAYALSLRNFQFSENVYAEGAHMRAQQEIIANYQAAHSSTFGTFRNAMVSGAGSAIGAAGAVASAAYAPVATVLACGSAVAAAVIPASIKTCASNCAGGMYNCAQTIAKFFKK